MRITRGSLILVGVLVGIIALTAPVSARFVPTPQTTTYTYTATPDTSTSTPGTTSATTTTTTTAITESAATATVVSPPAVTTQPSTVLTDLTAQLNALLKQLIALFTTQLQDLQQQLAVKLGQQPAVTTAPATTPAAAATTTAQTTATSTAATTTAAVAENKPPRVNITYPYGGLEFTIPASTDVTASALDEDGSISKVEFFAGTNSLGTHTGSIGPWSVRWNSISAGTYTLTAKATDDKGGQTTSAPVTLKVKASSQDTGGFTDSPPTITIATTMTGTALTATATVSTYAGGITNVVWSRAASTTADAAYVTDATSPYNGNATLAVGQHTISAIVTNTQGSQTRTASTTVTTN